MEWLGHLYKSIELLDKAIVKCHQCPRLVQWREEVAVTKRKSYENEKYWGKPVPGFGSTKPGMVGRRFGHLRDGGAGGVGGGQGSGQDVV